MSIETVTPVYEEIYKNIYKIDLPLPKNPLKIIHCYVVRSEGRTLIIDTGFNKDECIEIFMEGMAQLNVDFTKTDLFITHLHADHSGLAGLLMEKGVKIHTSQVDGNSMNDMTTNVYWDQFVEHKRMFDLDKDEVMLEDHPGFKYCFKEAIEFEAVVEGDIINVGEYAFEVLEVPGHTPGQVGLYEKNHKIFFGGDHILAKITPNISFWGFKQDILNIYFNSLKKIYEYDIDYIFTAHRTMVTDHKTRIDELCAHHNERLDEVVKIIKENKMTVRDIAAKMQWQLRAKDWAAFPGPQKWFASGEAMAHLEHLYCTNRAERTEENGIFYYEAK